MALQTGSPYRQIFIVGGTCIAAAALAHLLRRRARPSEEPQKASEAIQRVPETATETAPVSELGNVSKASLAAWAKNLRKTDAGELPKLLAWAEKLLDEDPSDEDLLVCLAALQHLASPGHAATDRIAAVAVRASALDLENCLEMLSNLFKGNKGKRHAPSSEVVKLAASTLQAAIKGAVERGTYQRACRLLHCLSQDSAGRLLVIQSGGHTVILDAMESFKTDPGVMLEGCSFLLCMASESSLDVGRAVAAAILCMKNYGQNGELQWRSLALLHALPHWDLGDLSLPVTELACAAVDQHPRFDAVVEWAAKVLCRLVSSDRDVRPWLKTSAPKGWLQRFRELPYGIRKSNKEAERWVAELWRLCK